VYKGESLSSDEMPRGTADFDTDLTSDDPSAKLSLKRTIKGGKASIKLSNKLVKKEYTVRRFDLSRSGRYNAQDDTWVIHAIDAPVMPPDTYYTVDAFWKASKDYSLSGSFFKAALKKSLVPRGGGGGGGGGGVVC